MYRVSMNVYAMLLELILPIQPTGLQASGWEHAAQTAQDSGAKDNKSKYQV